MPVIAIDLGTTGCKSAIFDGSRMLGSAYHHYSYSSPQDGWAEQDAENVWNLVSATVRQALAASAPAPAITAICISVQGDAIIPIDTHGGALHPAILGMDTRSWCEASEMEENFGRGQLYSATGMPCEPLNSITKVWWLVRNRPELRDRLWKFVHYGEFLLMKLAAVPALDFTMASRTMAFHPVRKNWIPEILDFAGVTPAQLGNVAPPGAPAGIILKSVADDWGISRTALVVLGGHDQCMAAVGCGAIEPDLACYSMGTAEVISTCFVSPRMTSAMLESNYPCYCHAAADLYFTITLNQSGGLSLEWFQDHAIGAGHLAGAIEQVRVEPSPVLFLPHLVGSGTPSCDHLSRAAFLGLSLKTGRAEMLQAVADSLAFEARINLESLESLGIPVAELRAVGGGARSRRMLELKATVLNRPICTLRNREAALMGAAMLAQVAVNEFPDLAAAVRECVAIETTIEPRSGQIDAYAAAFERYRQLYSTLKSFYHHWRSDCPVPVPV
jgi:xylulokinase